MNNNITEDYCSPKVSSLLEEKGMARGAWLVPTQALAIKWIRLNFGIHIWVRKSNNSDLWFWRLDNPNVFYNTPDNDRFNSFEETANAALLYTLKHLI